MPKLLPDQSFYPSPTMAMEAPVETIAYVALLNPDPTGRDALAVLDVDPGSSGGRRRELRLLLLRVSARHDR
jgi:selenium-binding protein 1